MSVDHIDKVFGGYIATRRAQAGLSAYKLAMKSRITYGRMRTLEDGTAKVSVRWGECERLAEVLNVDVREVLRIAGGGC